MSLENVGCVQSAPVRFSVIAGGFCFDLTPHMKDKCETRAHEMLFWNILVFVESVKISE